MKGKFDLYVQPEADPFSAEKVATVGNMGYPTSMNGDTLAFVSSDGNGYVFVNTRNHFLVVTSRSED